MDSGRHPAEAAPAEALWCTAWSRRAAESAIGTAVAADRFLLVQLQPIRDFALWISLGFVVVYALIFLFKKAEV